MATEVIIPAMGESISSGILAAWHVKDGDYVEKDQAIYELETDKITSEANAEVAGIISLKVAVDDEVDIGQVVATIDESVSAPAGEAAAAPVVCTTYVAHSSSSDDDDDTTGSDDVDVDFLQQLNSCNSGASYVTVAASTMLLAGFVTYV